MYKTSKPDVCVCSYYQNFQVYMLNYCVNTLMQRRPTYKGFTSLLLARYMVGAVGRCIIKSQRGREV